jgi:hypothetical protein
MYTNEEFKQLTIRYRVGAVLSDGQWYTADKIRTCCHEPNLKEIQPILNDMVENDQVIPGDNGVSYRMSLAQMKTWRNANGMSMEDQPIPKLIYPRIFGRGSREMTEIEMFEKAPLHQVSILTFMLHDPSKIDDIRRDLGYLGKFKPMSLSGKFQLYALSNSVAKNMLLSWEASHGGEGSVFVKGKFNSNNSSRRRELAEMSRDAVNDFIIFYIQFAKYLVPSIKKTFNVYIGGSIGSNNSYESRETTTEGDAVIMQWLLTLIQTYDEKKCVPFSYLIVMQFPRKTYDYSSKVIGDDLNRFQLEKNRAIKRLKVDDDGKSGSSRHLNDKSILREMNKNGETKRTMREYEDLNLSLKTWQKSYSPQSLDWSETGEEKKFTQSPVNADFIKDIERRSNLHHAIIMTAIDTKDWYSEEAILSALVDDSIASAMISGKMDNISNEFKDALARNLYEVNRNAAIY